MKVQNHEPEGSILRSQGVSNEIYPHQVQYIEDNAIYLKSMIFYYPIIIFIYIRFFRFLRLTHFDIIDERQKQGAIAVSLSSDYSLQTLLWAMCTRLRARIKIIITIKSTLIK